VFRLLAVGMVTWIFGAGLNLVALTANGGLFPESAPGAHTGYVEAPHARLSWLGDWLPIGDLWFSPGDLFIYGGLAVVAVAWLSLVVYGIRTGKWRQYVRHLSQE